MSKVMSVLFDDVQVSLSHATISVSFKMTVTVGTRNESECFDVYGWYRWFGCSGCLVVTVAWLLCWVWFREAVSDKLFTDLLLEFESMR